MGKATGRPTKYDQNVHPDWAWSLAIQGLTEKEIADKMGITRSTLSKWKVEHDEFREALQSGKEPTDAKVIRSLLERATGYAFKERKIISTIDSRTGKPNIERIETMERFIPPDTTAIIYWLKNRRRNEWRDRWDVDVNADKDLVINILPASERKEDEKEE